MYKFLIFLNICLGNALTQYDVVETKHCHKVFIFFKHCTTDHHSVPRGFKTDELQVIFTALRASAYSYLLKEIKTPPSSLAHFDSMRESMLEANEKLFPKNSILGVSDDHESLIYQLIDNIIKKVPEIERDLEQNRTTVVDKIVDRGFTSFKEQADIEQHNGVNDEYFNDFLDNLRSDLSLPANYDAQFKETMQVTLFSNSNVWVVFNIIFSINTGADCKFVCVMATHDSVNKKTDWLVANVGATFELAPNLLVVQTKHSYVFGAWSDSEEKIVLKPASLSQNNLDLVFEFFEVVSFQRFAEFLNINSPHLAIGDPKPLGDAIAALGLVKSAITIVTSTWESIVNAFKTTKTSELKQILQGNGFNYYSQSGEMQKVTGLVESYYDTFANELLGRIQVPDDKKTAFQRIFFKKNSLKYIDLFFIYLEFFGDFKYIEDDNEWKAFHTVFSIGAGGECKFVAILAHHNTTTHTIDLLIGDFVASFKLAPNVAVIQESASYAGGIYSDSKVVFKDLPRSVTEDDLKAIFDFFYIVTYKNFGDMVGVSVNFPSLH